MKADCVYLKGRNSLKRFQLWKFYFKNSVIPFFLTHFVVLYISVNSYLFSPVPQATGLEHSPVLLLVITEKRRGEKVSRVTAELSTATSIPIRLCRIFWSTKQMWIQGASSNAAATSFFIITAGSFVWRTPAEEQNSSTASCWLPTREKQLCSWQKPRVRLLFLQNNPFLAGWQKQEPSLTKAHPLLGCCWWLTHHIGCPHIGCLVKWSNFLIASLGGPTSSNLNRLSLHHFL